jgi:Mg2+-importing ATPase
LYVYAYPQSGGLSPTSYLTFEIASRFLGDITDAVIILTIVIASGLLGFWQEKGAASALAKLLAVVQTKATVLRDGNSTRVPVEEIVPGDIVVLSAGVTIPGDSLLLESADLFLDKATLIGETYPVEKKEGLQPAETPLSEYVKSSGSPATIVLG